MLQTWADRGGRMSARLNAVVERVCVAIAVVLVLDIWLGVLARHVLPVQLTFTEEAARYLMIWMALLAVSCGIARREHIGVALVFDRFPPAVRLWLLLVLDLTGAAFFGLLFVYGVGFAIDGADQVTLIYDLPHSVPFAAVPVAAALAFAQTLLVAVRDQGRLRTLPDPALA